MQVPEAVKSTIVEKLSGKFSEHDVLEVLAVVIDAFSNLTTNALEASKAAEQLGEKLCMEMLVDARANVKSVCSAYSAVLMTQDTVLDADMASMLCKNRVGYIYMVAGKPLAKHKTYFQIGMATGGKEDKSIQSAAHEFIRKKGCSTSRVIYACEVIDPELVLEQINESLTSMAANDTGFMYRKSKQCYIASSQDTQIKMLALVCQMCGYTFK